MDCCATTGKRHEIECNRVSGHYADGKTHRVRVRLHGWAARIATERRWHPSQEVKELKGKDRSVELTFEIAGFEEVTRWVLSWGGQAEVIAPKGLRERVADEIARAGQRY